jgi:hypothetical protein
MWTLTVIPAPEKAASSGRAPKHPIGARKNPRLDIEKSKRQPAKDVDPFREAFSRFPGL